MTKLRYELDPHNRLVVKESGKRLPISKFRRVLDGTFRMGRSNSLRYHVKSSLDRSKSAIKVPHQLKLKGRWSLTDNHDLRLTLDKWGRKTFGDQITLQGEIVGAERDRLIFAVTTRTKERALSTYTLKLEGAWMADKKNRLVFRVRKARSRYDTLTFDSAWELDKNHRIVYRYEKSGPVTKRRIRKSVYLRGYWDIARKGRLSYSLDARGDSSFDFKAGIGRVKKSAIIHELAISVSRRRRPVRRIVALHGRWRVTRRLGLVFEVEYDRGEFHAIAFGAQARVGTGDTITFRLKSEEGSYLGLELTIKKRFLGGDGEAFFRALKRYNEIGIYAGAAWRW